MTEKRFTIEYDGYRYFIIIDNENECGIARMDTMPDAKGFLEMYEMFIEENEELKEHIKSLEKQCHLIHMQSMFSTVKSFKGDVSKRYKYSEKTDNIYDTANHYGQYDKVLDKKEITILLNEYETILKELKE